jgi:alkylation response protein AidB-like acyl-CoA dehydrogenase
MKPGFDDPHLFSFDDQFASLISLGKVKKRTLKQIRADCVFTRDFCRNHLRPLTLSTDLMIQKDHRALAAEMLDLAVKHRLLSRNIPRFMGGDSNGVLWSLNPCAEEAASVEPAFFTGVLGGHGLGTVSLMMTQNFKVIDWFAQQVIKEESEGRPFLIDTAITEPMAGTDVEDMELLPHAKLVTRAERVTGGAVLNGRKCFITGGHLASCHVVLAPFDLQNPVGTLTMFLIPKDAEGFSLGRLEEKMGHKAGPASELIFEDCFVPDDHIVFSPSDLPPGKGELLLGMVLGMSRISVGATGTGIARGAFEMALSFAKQRRWRGQTVISHQWAQESLTDMLAKVYMARAVYLEATHVLLSGFLPGHIPSVVNNRGFGRIYRSRLARTWRHSKGFQRFLIRQMAGKPQTDWERLQFYSSMAKVVGTDAGMENCHQALELMGKAGLRHDAGAEKLYRDAKLCQIFEGTNQLNRLNMFKHFIARDVPGLETF